MGYEGVSMRWHFPRSRGEWLYFNTYTLIFNHDFAKALWGDQEELFHYPESEVVAPNNHQKQSEMAYQQVWRYHLQQMVIADDPIQYLGENI
jgi:hypothetical protein